MPAVGDVTQRAHHGLHVRPPMAAIRGSSGCSGLAAVRTVLMRRARSGVRSRDTARRRHPARRSTLPRRQWSARERHTTAPVPPSQPGRPRPDARLEPGHHAPHAPLERPHAAAGCHDLAQHPVDKARRVVRSTTPWPAGRPRGIRRVERSHTETRRMARSTAATGPDCQPRRCAVIRSSMWAACSLTPSSHRGRVRM